MMMKLTALILLAHALSLTAAFTRSSSVILGSIKQARNPKETITGNYRYGSHVRTRNSYGRITPESPEYQEDIKGNFTTIVAKKPSINYNITSLLTGINLLQAGTAGLCVAGRLPVLQNAMSFLVGKGLVLGGLVTMGLAWNQTRNAVFDTNGSEKKKSLITTGLYSHVRHPFLAGQWMVLLGFAGSCWKEQSPMRYFLAGLYYLVLRKKVEMEEEQLEKQFGHEYQVYKVLVKGQLIPKGISSKFGAA